jgi:hypothetical protein
VRHVFGAFVAFFVGMACLQTAEANQFSVISTNIQSKGDLIRIEHVVQNGPNASNRFGYYRVVRKEHVLTGDRGAFILLPSLSQKFDGYELGDSPDGNDYENSVVANLAEAGLDVYGYSPRPTFVAPGACEDGRFDCSIMADWGINAVMDDLKFIRAAVFLHHGLDRPLIGGYSQGASSTSSLRGRRTSTSQTQRSGTRLVVSRGDGRTRATYLGLNNQSWPYKPVAASARWVTILWISSDRMTSRVSSTKGTAMWTRWRLSITNPCSSKESSTGRKPRT